MPSIAPIPPPPVWSRILVLVAGAVLAPGKRTVSQALRVVGLAANPGFSRFHEVLNRARWDGRAVARTLLVQVLGVDDTIERRWGPKRGCKPEPQEALPLETMGKAARRWQHHYRHKRQWSV